MLATPRTIRFSVEEYFKMSEAGIFDGRRVELLEGRIVPMHAQGSAHWWTITRTSRILLDRFAPDQFGVAIQGTLRLGSANAPDPDLSVYAAPEGTHESLLPLPFLVIEISDTTYRKDSGVKLRMYAAAGIGDYWIVNLPAKRIEVYREPSNKTGKRRDWHYASVEQFVAGQKIRLLKYPKISVGVSELLPPSQA